MIIYNGSVLKNALNKNQSVSCQCWHDMAFKHHISIATNLAANFGCNQFRIMLDIVSKLKNLRIKHWSLSYQCCFHVSNITSHLQPIWLQTLVAIDSESWPFEAIARRHLKLPCYLILIWADALFLERLINEICCFAKDSIRKMRICSYVMFYSETNELSKDWAKRWELLWSVTISRQFHHFT